jgi:hypothetical protein
MDDNHFPAFSSCTRGRTHRRSYTSPCFTNPERVSSIANYFAPDPVGAWKEWIEFALGRPDRQHAVHGKRIRSLHNSISYAAKTAAPSVLLLQNDDPPKEVQSTGHRLFLEAGGNIGLAPGNIRNADLLCQFQNCDIAVIVRACGDRFSIVGRAAVALRQDEEEVRLNNVVQEKFYSSMVGNVYSGPGRLIIVHTPLFFYLDPITLQDLTCLVDP